MNKFQLLHGEEQGEKLNLEGIENYIIMRNNYKKSARLARTKDFLTDPKLLLLYNNLPEIDSDITSEKINEIYDMLWGRKRDNAELNLHHVKIDN